MNKFENPFIMTRQELLLTYAVGPLERPTYEQGCEYVSRSTDDPNTPHQPLTQTAQQTVVIGYLKTQSQEARATRFL